ncbi:tyrosine-type recombinase/integrase [Methyloterricola oryzae]|uniref:tyrosine-type recombinase/integrase n=1 Tax=Methyloterricola oryzae TaxID=1495050 RepID=UPI0009E54A32|nr:site-specific integrase [Methyloterricola oryzae]
MPYKRKDSPIWWASYADPSGKRVRRSTGTSDRKEADALEAKWKLETYRLKQWNEQPARTFDELMLAYLMATDTKKSHLKDLQRTTRLRGFFGGRTMDDLGPTDVRGYIASRKALVSNSTVNRELALLSSAINWARKECEWDIPNPVSGRKLKEPEGRVRWLTPEDAGRLIQAASELRKAPHLSAFIRLALNTGCRSQEILGLEWRRVDLGARLIVLEAEHTKSNRRRSVPLNDEAFRVILERARFRAQHCPDSQWVFCNRFGERLGSLKKGFWRACELTGISDFRIHDLRHTCAAWLVSAGVPLTEVRDLLGHSTVKMTERYAHLAPENIRAAVAVLDGLSQSGHATQKARKKKELRAA